MIELRKSLLRPQAIAGMLILALVLLAPDASAQAALGIVAVGLGSIDIPVAFEQKFSKDFHMLAQQKGSHLRNTVRDDPTAGAKHLHFDRIGATSMQRKTSRHMDTPTVNTPHSRRRVSPESYVWADLIDRADLNRMMKNPQQSYMTSGIWAAGRQIDGVIISAANGNATSVDSDDATSSVALPTAQKIVHGGTGLTLAKVLEAKKKLDKNKIPKEDRFLVYAAEQLEDMLNTTEVKSSDYNTVKALVQGEIDTFLGFKWIHTEELSTDSSSNRLVLAYWKMAMGLYIPQDITTRLSERADKNYSIQAYAEVDLGAVRIEDEGVVQIACVE